MGLGFAKDIAYRLFKITRRHAPEILAGIGIGGFITTTVLAVKATPEAEELIENKKAEENKDELTVMETVSVAWKPYAPAIFTGIMSGLAVAGSVSTSLKRTAGAITLCETYRSFIRDYRDTVIDTIGEKKEKKIMHETNQKLLNDRAPSDAIVNMRPAGKRVFRDSVTGIDFWSTVSDIERGLKDCEEQANGGPDNMLGVIDYLMYLGAFDSLSSYQRQEINDRWMGIGWSVSVEGKPLSFEYDRATLDPTRGDYVGVIRPSFLPIDDFWSFYR